MKESSKAIRRRWVEDAQGVFPWRSIFAAPILDIGSGDDPLKLDGVTTFDKENGDANKIDEYFEPESFQTVHASHLVEHLFDPSDFIVRCLKILKKGGHIVFFVPSFDEYEKRVWPSVKNGDHKFAFSMWRKSYPNVSNFIHVPTLVKDYNAKLCRLVLTNFDFNKPDSIDQTIDEADGCECGCEVVIQK